MSACVFDYCSDKTNIWKISNENKRPPFYKKFFTCDEHLKKNGSLNNIHAALVKGRYTKQLSGKVSYNGWIFEKVVSTWKNEDSRKCSDCGTIQKIWMVVKLVPYEEIEVDEQDDEYSMHQKKYRTSYLCDEHFIRREDTENLKIRSCYEHEGISTFEPSWHEKQQIEEKAIVAFSRKKSKIK